MRPSCSSVLRNTTLSSLSWSLDALERIDAQLLGGTLAGQVKGRIKNLVSMILASGAQADEACAADRAIPV